MASTLSLLLFVSIWKQCQATQPIYGSSIICDGGTNHEDCDSKILYCYSTLDCTISVIAPSRRRRNLLAGTSSNLACAANGDAGACGTTVICPTTGHTCEIQCEYPCDSMKIEAEDAQYVKIWDCQQQNTYDTCNNIDVHCPTNDLYKLSSNSCKFDANSIGETLSSINIYTTDGFNDITIDSRFDVSSSTLYCGASSEYNCPLNSNGDSCSSGGVCLPTTAPTSNPTAPTDNPSFSPTQYPTTVPTISPTNVPTISPTDNPTVSPSNNPTNPPSNSPTMPTINPSSSPTEMPTLPPSNNPTEGPTPHPTLYIGIPTDNPSQTQTTTGYTSTNLNNINDSNTINGSGQKGNSNNNSSDLFDPIVWLIIFIAIMICCCVIFFWFAISKKRKKNKNKMVYDGRETGKLLAKPLLSVGSEIPMLIFGKNNEHKLTSVTMTATKVHNYNEDTMLEGGLYSVSNTERNGREFNPHIENDEFIVRDSRSPSMENNETGAKNKRNMNKITLLDEEERNDDNSSDDSVSIDDDDDVITDMFTPK